MSSQKWDAFTCSRKTLTGLKYSPDNGRVMAKKPTASKTIELTEEVVKALDEWRKIDEWLGRAKAREMELRRFLANFFIPAPSEGVNNLLVNDDMLVKMTHKVTRAIDKAALPAVLSKLGKGWEDALIEYTPELVVKAYRNMPDDLRRTFDQALVIKDGAPTLEILKLEQ